MDTESQARRVFVGNLSYQVRWQELKDFMRDAGEVVRADILVDGNGSSRGCGIVEYATAEEAANAVETKNHTTLEGRQIFVREDREAAGANSRSIARGGVPNAVFVGNLPFTTSWQDLKDLLRPAGTIVRAAVHKGPQGLSRGRATVVFETADGVKAAIAQFNGTVVKGRTIEVREDLPLGERPIVDKPSKPLDRLKEYVPDSYLAPDPAEV